MILTIVFRPNQTFEIDSENYDEIRSTAVAQFWTIERSHNYMEAFYWLDSQGNRHYVTNNEQFQQRDAHVHKLYFVYIHEKYILKFNQFPEGVLATVYWAHFCSICGMQPLIGDDSLGSPPNRYICELCSKQPPNFKLSDSDVDDELEEFEETTAVFSPNLPAIVEDTNWLQDRKCWDFYQNANADSYMDYCLYDETVSSSSTITVGQVSSTTTAPTAVEIDDDRESQNVVSSNTLD